MSGGTENDPLPARRIWKTPATLLCQTPTTAKQLVHICQLYSPQAEWAGHHCVTYYAAVDWTLRDRDPLAIYTYMGGNFDGKTADKAHNIFMRVD